MNISSPNYLNSCSFDPLLYCLVGDGTFRFKTCLVESYSICSSQISEQERLFHYRLSRARGTIENMFGVPVARCKMHCLTMIASAENEESYVLATISLRNYPRLTYNAVFTRIFYWLKGWLNSEIQPMEWTRIVGDVAVMTPTPIIRGSSYYLNNTATMREALKKYQWRIQKCFSWNTVTCATTGLGEIVTHPY